MMHCNIDVNCCYAAHTHTPEKRCRTPNLGSAQQRNPKIPANRELLAIGAQVHACAVSGAVSRVEDLAVLVGEPLPLHALDEGNAKHRGVFLLPFTFCAAPACRVFARLREHPDDLALISSIPICNAEPALRLTGIVALFPKARSRRLCGISRVGQPAEREQKYERQSHLQGHHLSHATTSTLPV